LCRLITRARRRTQKGQYPVLREDFNEPLPGLLALWVPDAVDDLEQGRWLQQVFAERLWLAVQLHRGQDDQPPSGNDLLALAGSCGFRPWPAAMCTCTRAWPARLAGHHDRDPPSPAGGRCRVAPAPQRRTAFAQPRRPLRESVSAALLDETVKRLPGAAPSTSASCVINIPRAGAGGHAPRPGCAT
jgi:hypothetical protein